LLTSFFYAIIEVLAHWIISLSDSSVDYEARQVAALAMQQISNHEIHCGERWGQARDEMKTLRKHVWLAFGSLLGLIEFIVPLLKKFIEG